MAVVIDGTNGVSSPDYEVDGVTGQLYPIVSGTAKAWNWNGLTTNKAIDFTDIPPWVKRITVMFQGVSTNGSSLPIIQLGTSAGVQTSGYLGAGNEGSSGASTPTSGIMVQVGMSAAVTFSGQMILSLVDSSVGAFAAFGVLGRTTSASATCVGASKILSGTLTQVRITTVSGADNFDAGTINIIYE